MDPKKSGKRMSVSFTASQAAALERASLATGATQASILAIALDDWLRRREATASEDSVPAMVRLVNEALGTHVGRHVVAEEIPYGDDGVALIIDGRAWAGCDADDLRASWRAWQSMTPDEHQRWREDPGFRPLGE